MKNMVILGLSVMFLLSGCNKYPEGPSFSLSSKKGRLSNVWQFSSAIFDGNDVTTFWKNYTWTINKDNTYTFATPNSTPQTGTWEFIDDDERVRFDPEVALVSEFTILQLEKEQLKLEGVDEDGSVYVYILNPK